ncbi:MAG: hypothetical protein JWO33_2933 [Caulobacteraceae bacterium]|nr:hypothetical protein [Caulobacteraceae bacterium]
MDPDRPRLSEVARQLSTLPRPARMALYAVATAVLLYMGLAPTRDLPGVGLFWDKWEHLVAWFILTLLGFLLSPRRPRAIVAFAVGLGAGIELLQATMGFGRQGDILDLIADSLGVFAAITVTLIARSLPRR